MFRRLALGETAWQWDLGESISESVTERVMWVYRCLEAGDLLVQLGVHDIVPAYTSIAVYFSLLDIGGDKCGHSRGNIGEGIVVSHSDHGAVLKRRAEVADRVETLMNRLFESVSSGVNPPSSFQSQPFTFNVDYSGEDLPRVAKHVGVDLDRVIEWHSAVSYKVAMIGFLPHFPYLIGLKPELTTPRLVSPRSCVPKGAVAIGGAQTGIYPADSPGGWNIIGYTDVSHLSKMRPGDSVVFEPIF